MLSDLEHAVQKECLVRQHLEIWGSGGEESAMSITGLSLEMAGRGMEKVVQGVCFKSKEKRA